MAERRQYRDEQPKVLTMRGFVGVDQSYDEEDMDFRYSKNAYNCDTRGGVLKPSTGYSVYDRFPAAPSSIRTLMPYFRATDGFTYYLAATDTDLLLSTGYGAAWASKKGALPISSGEFSFVNYQSKTQDIVVFSNGQDDVYQWNSVGNITKLTPSSPVAPRGKDLALANERIWSGVFELGSSTNALYWSDDQNPGGWVIATDAAGTLQNPTWDGDRVMALTSLFGEIVVFKRRSAFRILGTYPKEFRVAPIATSIGALNAKSVVQYNKAAFFMADEGLCVYDGVSCKVLGGNALKPLMAARNRTYDRRACGAILNDRLYMAICTGSATENNTVVEYSLIDGSFMVRTGVQVLSWMPIGESLFFSGGAQVYQYNSGTTYNGSAVAMRWDTPISALGAPNAVKRAVRAYIIGKGGNVKLTTIGDAVENSVTVALPTDTGTVQTRLTGRGRRMGWRIENVSGSTPEINEIRIEYEEDED